MNIKPIETEYNGYRFRSRLEARWAVFFDALGVKYEYEPEGFELSDGTKYLPDFYLPESGWWVEIKGSMSDSDLHKIMQFRKDMSSKTNEYCKHIVLGDIPTEAEAADLWEFAYNKPWTEGCAFDVQWDYPYLPCICPVCGKFGFEFDGRGARVCEHAPGDKGYTYNSPRVVEAYRRARQARFEHGEKPDARR